MLLNRRNPAARYAPTPAVERVLQVGEGNFIRAFVDWLLQKLHDEGLFDGAVVLTPARAQGRHKIAALDAQDDLFTVWTRGEEVDRTDVVSIVSRTVNPFEDWPAFLACAEQRSIDVVISNTTEMGIAYTPAPRPVDEAPATFPARLAAYLQRRFEHFEGDPAAGLVVVPCELVDDNGATLRDAVLRHAADWEYGPDFACWVREHNVFCNTLVDRITPGFPADAEQEWQRLGYEDRQLVVSEPFYIWAIEAHEEAMRRLPFHRSGLNVPYTPDLRPYRIQKLRVLNGAHTIMAPLGLLLGVETVRDAVTHALLGPFIRRVVDEIVVPYSEMDVATLRAYADTVFERFLNPFVEHRLANITLNSLGKFRIRLLPVLLRYYEAHGAAPPALALALAAQLILYRPASSWRIDDVSVVTEKMAAYWNNAHDTAQAVRRILADAELWGQDLTAVSGLTEGVTSYAERLLDGRVADCLNA